MQILNIFHVLLAIGMVALILVQRGTGATAGAAFGSGASGTVFGARGAGNFLTRMTAAFATAFFVVSLTMAVMASRLVAPPEETDLGVVGNTIEVPVEGIQEAPTDIPVLEQSEPLDVPAPETTVDAVPDSSAAESSTETE